MINFSDIAIVCMVLTIYVRCANETYTLFGTLSLWNVLVIIKLSENKSRQLSMCTISQTTFIIRIWQEKNIQKKRNANQKQVLNVIIK